MGRKSSAKNQSARPVANPPNEPPRSRGPSLVLALIAVLAIVALVAYSRSAPSRDASKSGDKAAGEIQTDANVPEAAKHGAHHQDVLPPLPFGVAALVRPVAEVTTAYTFAAEHPEILSYVPCYCGCEREGHRGNEDCFVTKRAANGDVTGWEPHGMT